MRIVLESVATGFVTLVVYLLSFSRVVSGADDASTLVALSEGQISWTGGLWSPLSSLASAVPSGPLVLRIHLLNAVLAALSISLAVLVLRKASFSSIAAIGASLGLAFSYPLWSATSSASPGGATPAVILLFFAFFLLARQRPSWPTWVLTVVGFALLLTHLICLSLGNGLSFEDRVLRIPDTVFLDPSIPLAVLATVGVVVLYRRWRGDFWLWAPCLVLASLFVDKALMVTLSILPVATIIDVGGRYLPAPRLATVLLAAIAVGGAFVFNVNECFRRDDYVVRDYGVAVLASVPKEARIVASSSHQESLLRYFLEVRKEKEGVILEKALPERNRLTSDTPLFAVGYDLHNELSRYRAVPRGLVWQITRTSRDAGHLGSPWATAKFQNFSLGDPATFKQAIMREKNRVYFFEVAFSLVAAGDRQNQDAWIDVAYDSAKGVEELQALAQLIQQVSPENRSPVDLFQRVRALEPEHPAALRALAQIAFKAKDYKKAKKLVRETQLYHPREFPESYLLARIAEMEKDIDEAIRLYKRASLLDPDEHQPLRRLGLLHLRRGERKLAEDYFKKSLAVFPYQEDLKAFLPRGDLSEGTKARPGIPQPGVPRPGLRRPSLQQPRPLRPGYPGVPLPGQLPRVSGVGPQPGPRLPRVSGARPRLPAPGTKSRKESPEW